MANFGEWLTNAMENSGVKQRDLAKDCGVSQPTVSLWCRKSTAPASKYLRNISMSMNISLEEVCAAANVPTSDAAVNFEPPRPLLLGICGASGAGKSELVEVISSRAGKKTGIVTHVMLDDYYRSDECVKELPFQWENVESINHDLALSVLSRLKAGKDVADAPKYDKKSGHKSKQILRAAPIILVEGHLLFAGSIRDTLDLKIWITADRDVRLARRVIRDLNIRPADETCEMYLQDIKPAEDNHVLSQNQYADFSIDNNVDDLERLERAADLIVAWARSLRFSMPIKLST